MIWTLAVFSAVLFALPLGYFLWLWSLSRPPAPGRAVAPVYGPPDGIGPAEAGLLLDGSLRPRALAALLLDLALRGFMEIDLDNGSVARLRLLAGGAAAPAAPHERLVLDVLFAGGRQDIDAQAAAAAIAGGQRGLEAVLLRTLRAQGLFEDSGPGPLVAFGGALIAALIAALGSYPALGLIGAVTVGAVLVLLAQFAYFAATLRPRLTARGRLILADLLGFRLYLGAVEAERIKWEEQEAGTVDRLTPYAIVFNIDVTWSVRLQALTRALITDII